MIVSAYIFTQRFTGLRPGDENRLTHVNFSFALIKQGKATVSHWHNAPMVKQFINENSQIKSMLSIGGWGAGGFSPGVATPLNREALADSLVMLVDEFGFSGVDLVWQHPCDNSADIEASPDDKINFTLFVQLLREKLGAERAITIAAGATAQHINNIEIHKLMGCIDHFNLMTYDLCDWSLASHHTGLYTSRKSAAMGIYLSCNFVVQTYLSVGVPKDKLVIGAAFYGRVFKEVDGIFERSFMGPMVPTGGYPRILIQVEEAGGTLFDKEAQAPYAYDADKRIFITFENPRSLAAKVAYVESTGIKGLMFWEYTGDTDDSELLKAISQSVTQP